MLNALLLLNVFMASGIDHVHKYADIGLQGDSSYQVQDGGSAGSRFSWFKKEEKVKTTVVLFLA